ncbi:Phosphatidic acid phosphatase (PAP2) family protein [Thalictrum thalictroides]|uniref:Phosphatidic acid phosphatase (PAP2) family protein n=1 Tax=Thalictrum thalictroides TaxID=46969 RepID=A0A7J6WXS5_THATH|nr:Phosphatidic acid phosphatase (PAP2) family protein [Thalictrum thalictroides]
MEEENPSKAKHITTTATKPHSRFINNLINLDTTWSLHIHQICQPIPRSLLKFLEISGDGRFWFPIPIALFISLSSKSDHLRSLLIGLLIGSLLDLLFVGLIKFTIKRPRPVYNKGMHLTVAVDHWSFPSGHSSRVCFIASFLYLSLDSMVASWLQLGLNENEWIDSKGNMVNYFVYLVCLWSMLTSMSRVLLGRHFVFDVIAGACLGVFNAHLVYRFLKF